MWIHWPLTINTAMNALSKLYIVAHIQSNMNLSYSAIALVITCAMLFNVVECRSPSSRYYATFLQSSKKADSIAPPVIHCPDGTPCPGGSTCCVVNFEHDYGCCPYANGVCCADLTNCCPQGTVCNLERKTCTGPIVHVNKG